MKRSVKNQSVAVFERLEPRQLLASGLIAAGGQNLDVDVNGTTELHSPIHGCINPVAFRLAVPIGSTTSLPGQTETQPVRGNEIQVSGLWLVNADTDADISGLHNGMVINLATLSTPNLNVRATTDVAVGSVRFVLTGQMTRNQTENVAPYALFGDNNGDYNAGAFAVGQYTLVVTPYLGANLSGTVGTATTVSFSVINQTAQPTSGIYIEEGGMVVMEMEKTPSPLGLWQTKTDYANFTGIGYLQFTGNQPAGGAATFPLEYQFRINKPGLYYLHLRAARDTTHGQASDLSNDAFVRVDGDYGAGPNAGNTHGDDAPLNMLKSDTKFFGGNADAFAWASGNRLDPGGETNKRVAVYDFKAGEEYKLVVSGRSQYFSLDRIVFRHIDTATATAESLAKPESLLSDLQETGELKQWHKVTVTLDGPTADENGSPNPFLDYRMNVTFTHPASGLSYVIPGYFAADGDSANTGASSGNKWRAHLNADVEGEWTYVVSFRSGTNVAIDDSLTAGTSVSPYNGMVGHFAVGATDKTGIDNRGKGRLKYVGEHYLQFAGTGEYFLKQGTDAPENLLAYADFDGAFKSDGFGDNFIKTWTPHVPDWTAGDPTWNNGKGKGLIGAVNYLASEGLNAFSFLTMNINGDDKNVFPYTTYTERQRMDVSRLDQWEIVFAHGDTKGMYLHFKTQETENDQLLDGGALGTTRKLYYRELIARYSHHLAMNWNLGEENTNTTQQQKDFAQYFYDHDPYRHNVVLHTFPGQKNAVYTPLLGNASKLTGLSLQTSQENFSDVHGDTATWVVNSRNAGKKWVVAVDEPGDAQHALRPDNDAGNSHIDGRKNALWGTLMAGGAGNEWYFGYAHAHSDLTAQDFRSRDAFWDYTRYAKSFFVDNSVPFWQMINDNAISSATNDYGFYKAGEVYTVYLKNGGTTNLNLTTRPAAEFFSVKWFDPRNGGALQNGTVTQIQGGSNVSLGQAPNNVSEDWAILVQKISAPNNSAPTDITLSQTSINENLSTSADRFFANLAAVDSDVGDSHIFALIPGTGDTDNGRFAVVNNQLFIKQGQVIDFETKSSYAIRLRTTDLIGATYEKTVQLSVNNLVELSKSDITIGSSSARSRILTASIVFDGPVTFTAGAFVVTKLGTGGGPVIVTPAFRPNSNNQIIELTFSGSFVTAGSLQNGNYQLDIVANAVHSSTGHSLDTNSDGDDSDSLRFGDLASDKFFRMYGDYNGDRTVNAIDLLAFRSTYQKGLGMPGYLADFDANNDGVVNAADLLAFRNAYQSTLGF